MKRIHAVLDVLSLGPVAKMFRYDQTMKGYQQNRLFREYQKVFYKEINEEYINKTFIPENRQSQSFAVTSEAKTGNTGRTLNSGMK